MANDIVVGFIGLGTMGGKMATNIQKAGYKVVVHDLHRQSAGHHLQAGAEWADTPRALAERSDVIFTSLPEPADVERVALGADAIFVSSQYFVGDESNQAPKLESYTVFNAHASYQINKTFQIYGRINNLFDHRYATYGTFFDTTALPNFAAGGAQFTDARALNPAYPRTFYAGMKVTF